MDGRRREGARPGRGRGQPPSDQPRGSRKYEADAYLEDAVVEAARESAPHQRQPQHRKAVGAEEKPEGKREQLKALMTRLIVSESKQLLIRETLEQVTGKAFKHKQRSDYMDSGENLSKQYWMEDKQLQVYGVIKAKTEEELSPEQLTKNFAIKKLESYGFHMSYCEKALNITDGDVGNALEYMENQCFGPPRDYLDTGAVELINIEEISLEQRMEEKMTLMAIYDESIFQEVVTDRIWVFRLSPSYLSKYCRNTARDGGSVVLNLEIRFPSESFYPFEPPIVCVSVTNPDDESGLPSFVCLNMTQRLLEEARDHCQHHTPSVFSLISLLESEADMIESLQRRPLAASLPFAQPAVEQVFADTLRGDAKLLYGRRGDAKLEGSLSEMLKLNQSLKNRFRQKSANPTYAKMQEHRRTLPAWQHCNRVLSAVATSAVVVVSGMTGCGKSTQVPQFLLDEFLTSDNQPHRFIICTQPRRISAVAVAQRVAEERDEKVGQSVGYQIRLESQMSSSTRLLFCTTGVLLRRLEGESALNHVTHIIVDEVHERSEESDFLLLILRDMLTVRPDLRVILMSATLNSSLFSNYFGSVPVVDIPGRTFPVEQVFLEDILEKTNYTLEEGSPYTKGKGQSVQFLDKKVFLGGNVTDSLGQDEWLLMKEGFGSQTGLAPAKNYVRDEDLKPHQVVQRYAQCSDRVQRTMATMDHVKINFELIECLILWILNGQHQYPREGSILVFLPGLAEISTLYDQLKRNGELNPRSGRCMLVPLHSSLTSEEQGQIFAKPKPGVRKIVISTNLAETSITIEDCVFVIDSGRMKENRYDPNKHMDSLETVWVSVANALQRRGRAGRVRSGVAFHLYSSHRFQYQLAPQPPPEIHLVSLERVVLRCKTLSVFDRQSTESILDRLIEPPSKESVRDSMERLQFLGAIDSRHNLTPFGCHLAALPVDLRVGKLILFGAIFRCVDSALTIAACLSYKSPFTSPWKQRDEAQRKKLEWSVSQSDHLTVLKVFKAWQEACRRSKKAGYQFAEENFLSVKTLEMLCSLKQQFVELLSSIGFLPSGLSRVTLQRAARDSTDGVLQATGPKMNENGDNHALLLSVLCASLYPHLVRVLRPDHRYNQCMAGAVPATPRAQQLRFVTKSDGTVSIHPSSVLYSHGNFESPYIVYHEKMKTSRIFIRECSMVPAFPLILCGGSEIHVGLHRGIFVLAMDDGWIKFVCDSHQVAELLAALRGELNRLLADKIRDPSLDFTHDHRSDVLLATITKLITNPSSD